MTGGPEELAVAVARLRAGGVVAFPTETVYGLGADAFNERAVARIYALKGRPAHNPLIVHVADEDSARRVTAVWPEDASRLARRFWPGPLTLVLPRSPRLPAIVTAGGPNVGVRCPDHHLTLALLAAFGGPLVGPSANPSGGVSPTTAPHVAAAFAPEDVYALDGGPCRGGIESTVLTLAEPEPRILRAGLISSTDLADALGRRVEPFRGVAHDGSGPAPAPGMLTAHYAPRARMILFRADQWPDVLTGATGPVVVLTCESRVIPPPHSAITMPRDAPAYAARLYAALREADERAPSFIAVESPPVRPPDNELWEAVMDRLRRAAATRSA
jgi:L-threonylcarbamoyladenylate synthase